MKGKKKMGFGTPKYGNNSETFKKRNVWGLKESDTENVYRILPPMHSLADSGKWAIYRIVHWGFHGTNPNDSTKTVHRPFNCVEEVDRFKNVITECAQCVDYASKKAECEAAEALMKSEGKTKDEIEETLGSLKAYVKAFAPDKKFYMNVMNAAGEFGFLKIGYKAKKLLDAKIAELREKKKIDPLALEQGVWFNFKRSGTGRETQDIVDVVMESFEVEGETVEKIKRAPLSEDQINKALTDCDDLINAGGFKITPEQVEMLVASSGDPEDVDTVFNLPQRNSKPAEKVEKRETVLKTTNKEPAAPSTKASKNETKAQEPSSEVKNESNPEPKSEVKSEPKTKISNEEFLKKFRTKKSA